MIHELKKAGETFNTEYSMYGEDILIITPMPGYKDNVEAAHANIEWQQTFARNLGKKIGLIVMVDNMLSQDAESRKVYSEGMFPELFYGSALVVNNLLARAMGSFFIGLSKPKVPLNLVSSIEDGIAWLENLKKE